MSDDLQSPDGGPYPSPRHAFLLTIAAFVATGLASVFFLGLGAVVAIGIGQALAVGTIGTIAAKRVPEPQAERLGLRGLDLRSLPIILCLVPAVLLASEIDNYATDWSDLDSTGRASPEMGESWASDSELEPGADSWTSDLQFGDATEDEAIEEAPEQEAADPGELSAEERKVLEELQIDFDDPWIVAQAFVISVGITPVVEEFFFRGVLQQSLITRLGLVRGVGFVALLYTLPHLPAVATIPRFIAGVISAFGIGTLLGLVRIATGSILGSIVLASLGASIGIVSFALRDSVPIQGMNVEGTHLPILVTLASIVVVSWAARTVYEEAKQRIEEAKRSNSIP